MRVLTLSILALVLALPAGAQEASRGVNDEGADEGADDWGDPWSEEPARGWVWTGFVELGLGERVGSAPMGSTGDLDDQPTLRELRVHLETDREFERLGLALKLDGYADEVTGDLEGDLRHLTAGFSHGASDISIGRQVLTWGTGDFVFLNDLFPKDYQAFFSGRSDDYLKAASDTIRWSYFGPAVNLDLAVSPEFEPDRFLTGERFAFFDPSTGGTAAPQPPLSVPGPDTPEWAARLHRTVDGVEYAAYGYRGRFKSPRGVDSAGQAFFPRLAVWGASLRRPLGPGLINAEMAWYDSRQDPGGDDPAIPNDQFRLLIGWEQELVRNLTLSLQGYLERTLDHAALLAQSPAPNLEPARNRTVATFRLSHRAFQDRFETGLFAFVSPSDDDWHLRPRVDYRRDDHWTFTAGANLFGGDRPNTFFGQLEGNDNAYLRVRYHF